MYAGDNDVVMTLSAVDNMSGVLRTAEQSIIAFSGSAERSIGSIGRLTAVLGPVALIAGSFGAAAVAASNVQQQVANLNAVMRATPQQLQQIRTLGLQISQDSQFNERQIIEGQRLLAKSGADTIAILRQTKDVVNLGAATQTDPAQAAQAYIAAQKVFRQGVDQSTETVNILAQAVDSSVGTLGDYQNAFKQLGPVAQSAGLGLRDTSVAITDLMNSGLRGDTGTAVKTFLSRIEHETPAAKKAVQDLGLEFFDTSHRMKSMADIADELRAKTAGLNQETKNSALTQVFGTRGVRVADIYAEEGSQGITDASKHMTDIGSASDIAREKLDTVQGSFHKLTSSINVFGVQAGQGALPAIKSLTDGLERLANLSTTFGNANPLIPQLGSGAVLTAGAVLLTQRLQTARQQRAAQQAEEAAASAARSPSAVRDVAIQREQSALIEKEVNLQQQLRNARIQANEANVTVGAVNAQEQMRVVALEKELDLLRTKGALEADIFAAETAAAAAGAVRTTATLTALKEQEEIAQRQIMARNLVGAPIGKLPANVAATQAEQNFLGTGGDLVGLQAYRRDLAAYEAEVARLNSSGLKITKLKFAPPNIRDYEQQVAQAIIPNLSQGPMQIPTTLQPIPGKVVATPGPFKAAIGGFLAKLGPSLGELVMPLVIGITAEQLIIEPVLNAIQDKIVKNRTGGAAGKIDLIGGVGDSSVDYLRQQSKAAQDEMDKLEARNRQLKDQTSGRGGFRVGGIFADSADKGEIERNNQLITEAKSKQDQLNESARNAPSIFKQEEITRANELGQAVVSGKITVEQAEAQWAKYTEQLDRNTFATREQISVAKDRGLSEEAANELAKNGLKIIVDQNLARLQEIATLRAAQEAYQDQYTQNIRQMDQARAMGVPDATISQGIFGVTADGLAATKEQVRIGTDEIKRYADAWNQASSAAGKIDSTRGIAGLVGNARDLREANSALAQVGQQNRSLTIVGQLADRFKAVSDAEALASAAMDGYNLTLTETDRRMKEIGTEKSGFTDALAAAQTRQLQGRATNADLDLIKNREAYYGKLEDQGDKLSQNASKDWVGKLNNLPDLAAADQYMRDMVDLSGGGKQVVMTLRTESTKAVEDINAIIKGPWETTIKVKVEYSYPGGAPSGPFAPWDSSVNEVGEPNDPSRWGNAGPPGGLNQPYSPDNPNLGTAGFNMYQKQSYGQYQGIVPGNSPLANKDTYSQLQEVAQRYNIDPDFLLAFMRQEGNFATDQGAGSWQRAAHNPGGLKWANQPGAKKGPESSEPGDYYASFGNYGDYFNAMAQTLTGYSEFQQGNAATTVGRWTKGQQGYANLPYKQQVDVANSKLDYYRQYRGTNKDTGAPASGGVGMEVQGPIDLRTTPGGGSSASNLTDSIFSEAQKHVGQQTTVISGITQSVSGWCEKIVDDILSTATGKDNRFDTADARVRAAMAGDPNAGTVISADQARRGDLVGWTGDTKEAGDYRGHIGVVSGQGKYIGTSDQGVVERNIAGHATYIRPPGSSDTVSGSGYAQEHRDQSQYQQSVNRTLDNAPDATRRQPWQPDVLTGLAALSKAFSGVSGENLAKGAQTFQEIIPLLTKTISYDKFGARGPDTQPDREMIAGQALERGLQTQAAFTHGLDIIEKGAGDVRSVFADIDKYAGPVAPMLEQQLTIMQSIGATQKLQIADKAMLLKGEQTHASLLKARQVEDTAEQKRAYMEQYNDAAAKRASDEKDTRDRWKIEDDRRTKTRKSEDDKTIINDAWTIRSRQLEDEGRLLDFNGTLRKKQLTDELTAAERQQRTTQSYFTAQEQMLTGTVAGSGNRNSRNLAREQLAITKDYDRQTSEGAKKYQDSLHQQIDDQSILVAQRKYDFETEKILETRKHDDAIKAIDTEQQRNSRKWEDDDRNSQRSKQNTDWRAADTAAKAGLDHQTTMWNLSEKRAKEDEDYAAWHAGMQERIAAETEIITQGNQDLAVVKGLIGQWEYLFPIIGNTANQIFQGAKDIGAAHGDLPALPTFPTASTGSTGGAGNAYSILAKALGLPGYEGGTTDAMPGKHEVGEHGGVELVFRGGEQVVNSARIRQALGVGGAYASAPSPININTTLSFDSGMRTIFDNIARSEIEDVVKRQAERTLGQTQTSSIRAGNSVGIRSIG